MKETMRVNYNTNNSWGFGGMVGTDIHYDNGLIHRKARNHHRHTGTSSANGWLVENISDEYPDFSIRIKGKASNTVYVYRNGESYRAFFKEWKNPVEHGETFVLLKTIKLES